MGAAIIIILVVDRCDGRDRMKADYEKGNKKRNHVKKNVFFFNTKSAYHIH
jgi:hypothetical protein